MWTDVDDWGGPSYMVEFGVAELGVALRTVHAPEGRLKRCQTFEGSGFVGWLGRSRERTPQLLTG
jgi:hypothetical protein